MNRSLIPKEERCSEPVYRGPWHTSGCSRRGKVTRGGNRYCAQHDPEVVNAKLKAKRAEWERQSDVQVKRWALERAATDLLEACKVALSALLPDEQVEQSEGRNGTASIACDLLRNAIAKAEKTKSD